MPFPDEQMQKENTAPDTAPSQRKGGVATVTAVALCVVGVLVGCGAGFGVGYVVGEDACSSPTVETLSLATVVNQLSLLSHPEGGYYAETYRSDEELLQIGLPSRFTGNRDVMTMIYYMLTWEDQSAFHKIKSDEIWNFYYGDPVRVYMINETAATFTYKDLGTDLEAGQQFQFVVENDIWFAAVSLNNETGWSLVGNAVAPGFDFADFELAVAANLTTIFPQNASLITSLCKS